MAKSKTKFVCSECGYETSKWLGKCPACMEWNTFTEEIQEKQQRNISTAVLPKAVPLSEVTKDSEDRLKTSMKELDRVLGGGIVEGSMILVGGDPGIGKSTLLLQICGLLSDKLKMLYVSGEESIRQIKLELTDFS